MNVEPEETTILVAVAAPNTGVTNVGLVANTAEPEPVSSVNAVARLAELKEPNDVVVLLDVIAPVRFGILVVDDAVPVNDAVIVPALKFPEPSLATIADAVFALVAVVALLETLRAVEIVASLVSTIPADALISALTITPAAIDVTELTEVISPVRFGILVVDDAVPVNAPTNVVAVTTPVKLAWVPNKDVVWVVIPAKVERPETFNCRAVKFVADVMPRVETPETLSWVTDAIPPITDVETPADVA